MECSQKYLIERDIHASTAMSISNIVGCISQAYPGIKIEVKDSFAGKRIEPRQILQILNSSHKFQKDSEIEVIVSGELPQEKLAEVADYIGKLFSKDA